MTTITASAILRYFPDDQLTIPPRFPNRIADLTTGSQSASGKTQSGTFAHRDIGARVRVDSSRGWGQLRPLARRQTSARRITAQQTPLRIVRTGTGPVDQSKPDFGWVGVSFYPHQRRIREEEPQRERCLHIP